MNEPTPRTEQLVMRAANREALLGSDNVTSSTTRDRKIQRREKRTNEVNEFKNWADEMFSDGSSSTQSVC